MSMQMEKPLEKATGKQKPTQVVRELLVEAVEQVVVEAVLEQVPAVVLVVDTDLDKLRLKRLRELRYQLSGNTGYGITYSPVAASTKEVDYAMREGEDILSSCEKTPRTLTRAEREAADCAELIKRVEKTLENKETPEQASARHRREMAIACAECDSSATTVVLAGEDRYEDSDEDLEVIGTLVADDTGNRGICETLYLLKEKSQPDLIAMAQGLHSGRDDPMYPGYIFDLDIDERLKSFPHRALVLPKLHHLQEEASRRAVLFKIRPMRKAARKGELIHWLTANPIDDPIDMAFVAAEANKTYNAIKLQLDEAASAERVSLVNRNWTAANWLRLYCCAIDDASRPFMLGVKDDCMKNRLELDGRNSSERPPTWHEKIAELYNSTKEYTTLTLPLLHDDFAEPKTLCFEDMPGGLVTAEDVKGRLADARAKLITVISKWELSGNGFGQRDEEDVLFGHFIAGKGDSRASFLKDSLGQKSHHLYLWHLSDIMGVLKNVLNVLSSEVSADSERIPLGLSQTQRKRTREATDDISALAEDRSRKQLFREEISVTLKSIGDGMNKANVIQAEYNLEMSVVTLRSAIAQEEDRIERYTVKMLACKDDTTVTAYERLVNRHECRLSDYEAQMAEKMHNINQANQYKLFRRA